MSCTSQALEPAASLSIASFVTFSKVTKNCFVTSLHHLSCSFCEMESCHQLHHMWGRFFYSPTGFGVRKKGHRKVNIFQNLPLNFPEIQAPLAPLHPCLRPDSWDTLSCAPVKNQRALYLPPFFLTPIPGVSKVSQLDLTASETVFCSGRGWYLHREREGCELCPEEIRPHNPVLPPPLTAQQLASRGIK